MEYIIEGTIKELSFDEKFFTIAGTEGYAIKQKKDGMEIRYNVLQNCGKDDTTRVFMKGLVCKQDVRFSTDEKNMNLLLQAASSGKKVQVKLEIGKKRIKIKKIDKSFPISSLTLLAE